MTLTPRIAALLTLPAMLWAGNALLGRLLAPSLPPLLLNCLRWWLALAILLPLGWRAVVTPEKRAEIRARWRPLAVLGLLGVGAYNALQYLALHTSTPINVTLIAASIPVWMMLVGAIFYRERPRPTQLLGALLSLAGVVIVLVRGDLLQIGSIRLVAGDLWILVAALSWAGYSWQLARPPASMSGEQRPDWNWAEALMVQVLFGLAWATLSAVGEAIWMPQPVLWSPTVVAALVFIAVGPSVVAYRCWGLGVGAVGPALAGFFANLTPLFAALLSAALLGEPPHLYHGLAFALIVGGIFVSNRR
ncbi:DMT family transporter [Rubrivivax gelatinosus]|uniref:EamA family transporter n=1 Tax=Rubrivivax gelatinosus TaxID=28068 RepID=A0ABS1DXS9_RUBGE|nr:DMT family transporter [Rubrivivax gelatinosus]MBK1714005.1 EamA family transporter [Rubrivivax gelatinosus]